MKIILIGDFPKDNETSGGVQGVLVNLTNELISRDGIELALVSTSLDSSFKPFDGKCSNYKLNFRGSFIKARKRFNQIVAAERPDVIHLQGVVPGVLLYKNNYRDIFVVTQHAILSEERLWQVSMKRKILFKVKELIEKYYFRKIQNVIFISQYNRNIYFDNTPSQDKFKFDLIPNPVNTIFLQNQVSNFEIKQNEIYYVGEIKKRKGLHVLLRSIHLLKQKGVNCKVHVIGGFKEGEYEKEIKTLISSLGLDQEINFCGWKNQMEIIEYTSNIPVFVLPSFQETLPLSIAEAMCQGKIVVATDICGIPEMIADGKSGYLFPPDDFLKLATVLEKVFIDFKKQKSISENAMIAGKKYDSKRVVDKTIDFYKRIIAAKSQ